MTVSDADTLLHPQLGIDGGLVSAGTASLTRCRGTWVRSAASVPSLIGVFAVFAAFFVLRSTRQVERFYACILEQFAPGIFPSSRVASEFFCSSKLMILEAVKVRRGLHRMR